MARENIPRWRLLLLLLLCAFGDALRTKERGSSQGWHHEIYDDSRPYKDLVSQATEYCYKQLVNDSSCCLDASMTPGVAYRVVRRPGTEWDCSPPVCKSELTGRRGDDYIWLPAEVGCSSPRVLFVHGGSWIYGSPLTSGYKEFAARMADATGAMVMVTDYPLVSLRQKTNSQGNFDDIMASSISALQWLAHNGPHEDCPADSQAPLFVAGDSAGGGSALSLAVLVGMHPDLLPGRRLAGGFFYSPWTNLMCNSPEYYHNAFAKIEESTFNKIVMTRTVGLYRHGGSVRREGNLTAFVGDVIFRSPPGETSTKFELNAVGYTADNESRLSDPVASPYFGEEEHLAGLPPLYLAVGSSESILGDSVVVAYNAAASGVDVQLDIHPGMWHVFPMYSEGCGGGIPLWNAVRVMNTTALFVRHISATGRPPFSVSLTGPLETSSGQKAPHTTISYGPAVPERTDTDSVGYYLRSVKQLQLQQQQQQLQQQQQKTAHA